MDSELVVNRKKKQVVVEELRKDGYEAFPKNSEVKKTKADEDEIDAEADGEEAAEADSDGGARDYDYLLSVSPCYPTQ
jgi:DNA topoisomerase II